MSILKFFPTQVYTSRPLGSGAKKLHDTLIQESGVYRKLDEEGAKWSKKNYQSGYTSYSSITDLPFRSSNFEKLKNKIDQEAVKFSKILEFDLGKGKLQMSACWVNMMGKGCHHAFHLHPLSVLSGTYFLQVPKGSGVFKIEDPRLPAFMASPPRKKNARVENKNFHEFYPKSGDLILFESWLKHEVTQSQASSDRISVSFNYDWV